MTIQELAKLAEKTIKAANNLMHEMNSVEKASVGSDRRLRALIRCEACEKKYDQLCEQLNQAIEETKK